MSLSFLIRDKCAPRPPPPSSEGWAAPPPPVGPRRVLEGLLRRCAQVEGVPARSGARVLTASHLAPAAGGVPTGIARAARSLRSAPTGAPPPPARAPSPPAPGRGPGACSRYGSGWPGDGSCPGAEGTAGPMGAGRGRGEGGRCRLERAAASEPGACPRAAQETSE